MGAFLIQGYLYLNIGVVIFVKAKIIKERLVYIKLKLKMT